MLRFLYSTVILPVFAVVVMAASLTNAKIRKGMRGRRNLFSGLEEFGRRAAPGPRLWVHVSSMGEFEQAKPIIETSRRQIPDLVVVVSFFSPSGFENSHRYPHADFVTYLPFDTRRNAARFLDLVQPTVALFIRYDIWPNHIWACADRHIPVILVNATMRASSARRRFGLRGFHHALFECMDMILTISESDARNFDVFRLAQPRMAVVGDTRFDRVEEKAVAAREKKLLPAHVVEGKKIVVAGSSWPEDEEMLLPVMFKLLSRDPALRFVIVPHEPTEEHLETLEYKLANTVRSIRFSHLNRFDGEEVILVDSIGILLSMYASADVAFVGGGFKSNVHNTLEPAVYGIPVVYGPRVDNSQEARQLRDAGGGFIVHSRNELYRVLRSILSDAVVRADAGARAGEFVHSRAGATASILEALSPYLAE
jgi:3-deoxy-D-manno-octulosonic-acid transferase